MNTEPAGARHVAANILVRAAFVLACMPRIRGGILCQARADLNPVGMIGLIMEGDVEV